MKPAPFEYAAPETLAEALALLHQQGGDSKVLAGGQSLIPVMNFRLAQPTFLIDVNRLGELAYVREQNGRLQIGALTRHTQIEHHPLIAQHAPLVHEAMPHVAHPQIRNRGTIGGSLAHADPAAELPVLAVALGGRFLLQSQRGQRWVSASDFFTGLFETALAEDELLTAVELPIAQPNRGYAFVEMARRHGDYALAGVAAWVELDAQQICRSAQLVYLNAGAIPLNAPRAAELLVGQPITAASMAAAAHTAQQEIDPVGDIHASADYKRHLAAVLTQRALQAAASRVTANL
ncbi:MAG: xanthine dehydrogenase family protein subunit M [Chloroflexi bacterium]|nr:xanthine dehydrogenase family protein subunit M [Chloroflexota bacterium]